MNLHYLQHVPFEDPAYLLTWAQKKQFSMTGTHLYRSFSLPAPNDIDALIIMGGPMGVHDEDSYPWLRDEKHFIASVIQSGKPVLGICLGAQLLADVLGARVYRNPVKEIGWFPVQITSSGKHHSIIKNIPSKLMAFQWHGDTFDLPDDVVHLMQSEACKNQAFVFGNHVLGLQFHLESTSESIERLIQHSKEDMNPPGPFIQSEDEIMSLAKQLQQSLWEHCERIMDGWIGSINN